MESTRPGAENAQVRAVGSAGTRRPVAHESPYAFETVWGDGSIGHPSFRFVIGVRADRCAGKPIDGTSATPDESPSLESSRR